MDHKRHMKGGHGLDLPGLGFRQVMGSCESLISIKCGGFLDELRN